MTQTYRHQLRAIVLRLLSAGWPSPGAVELSIRRDEPFVESVLQGAIPKRYLATIEAVVSDHIHPPEETVLPWSPKNARGCL